MQALGHHVFGLVFQVGLGPGPWQHDDGGDTAEFAGDRFRKQRRAGGLAIGRSWPGAPDDQVVGGRAARDVNVRDAGMVGEVTPDIARTGHDAQQTEVDERFEGGGVGSEHPVHHRVELEKRYPVMSDEFIEHVERRDGGDVASTEHETDTVGLGRGAGTETGG